ncbi:MAG TPA: HEPN domain-containing protein [Alphaproteobacteria bacterium]|nr:HEPN domain-containing protein [Alphaproteobacteria bacterium]
MLNDRHLPALAASQVSHYSNATCLEKAEEFLQAAHRGLDEGWYNSAVSRAYYAMFQAARAGLAAIGIRRPWWRHGSLQATFSTELVQRRKVYPAFFVRDFAEAMELRYYQSSPIERPFWIDM